MRVRLVPVDLTEPMEIKDMPETEFHGYVGGYLEQVRLGRYPGTYQWKLGDRMQFQVVPPDGSLIMLVNEEGIRLELPYNPRASEMYGCREHNMVIRGPAILLSEEVSFDGGEWADYRG